MDPVTLIVAALVAVLLIYIIQAFVPLGERYKQLLILIVIIVAILYAIGRL